MSTLEERAEERADALIERKMKVYSLELEQSENQLRILDGLKGHLSEADLKVFDGSGFPGRISA